jgi:hypothetical protein
MGPMASRTLRRGRLIVPAAALLAVIGGTQATAAPNTLSRPAAHVVSHGAYAVRGTLVKLSWHPFTLINGWRSASEKALVTGQPAWAIHNGVAYFRGAIKQPNPDASSTFAQLPSAARPARNLYIEVYTNGHVPGILYVGADGGVEAYDGDASTFTSLASVSYPTPAFKAHKLTLTNGWVSSQPNYDTGNPSYAVSGGVVYLSGSLHAGTAPQATVLPKPARPAHQMIVSVYTFDGSTGWLRILPTGQVEIFGSEATSYTSLANISYPVAATKWHDFKLEDGWTSGRASYHTADPSYAIIGGVVYLTGSMRETKDHVGLWANLPAGVRTAADVLEIETATANGTVGGLAVTNLFGLVSSTPFTNAQHFTSLGAIAYPQSS